MHADATCIANTGTSDQVPVERRETPRQNTGSRRRGTKVRREQRRRAEFRAAARQEGELADRERQHLHGKPKPIRLRADPRTTTYSTL